MKYVVTKEENIKSIIALGEPDIFEIDGEQLKPGQYAVSFEAYLQYHINRYEAEVNKSINMSYRKAFKSCNGDSTYTFHKERKEFLKLLRRVNKRVLMSDIMGTKFVPRYGIKGKYCNYPVVSSIDMKPLGDKQVSEYIIKNLYTEIYDYGKTKADIEKMKERKDLIRTLMKLDVDVERESIREEYKWENLK